METYSDILPPRPSVERIREDFPILSQEVNGHPLVYFDNAATTQKPLTVIEALTGYYLNDNANIHRGIHSLAERATKAFEETRDAVKTFLGAKHREEIIFTRGTTEGINLVAATWGRSNIQEGDEILLSAMEHHSNLVPWQLLAQEKKAKIKILPMNDAGELIQEEWESIFTERTKLVACIHVSNALGTVNPVKSLIDKAHQHGALVLIDGAQAASHFDLDMVRLDADFYVFSAHKLYGPTGVGILYGKKALLEAMPPYQGGGEMISEVQYESCTYNELPYKFEAGTPNIADVVAFKAALEYMQALGKNYMRELEQEVYSYARQGLMSLAGIKLIGNAKEKVSIQSFVFDDVHHQDLAILLDREGIAVRTGHHCTQPLMGRLKLSGTTRASFSFYNTKEEVDQFIQAMHKALKLLR